MKEDITSISQNSKFRGCRYPSYTNDCCRTLTGTGLALKVKCLLVIFANGLRAGTDSVVGMQSIISVVPAVNKAVPGRSECS